MSKQKFYHSDLKNFYLSTVHPESTVLELGCGGGDLLNFLQKNLNCQCIGVDISEEKITIAKSRFPEIKFIRENANKVRLTTKIDVIILSDLVGIVPDVQEIFENTRKLCAPETRIILNFYNYFWEPISNISQKLHLIPKTKMQNWLSIYDIRGLLELTNFEVVKSGSRLLLPKYLPVFAWILNKYIARFPPFKKICFYLFYLSRQ